jgi:type IX secretion system PorP/SprF family membrane protein
MFVNEYTNPAACGIKNTTEAAFIYRYQWLGYETTNGDMNASPQSQLLTLSTKIREINSGIGLFVLNDKIGPIRSFNAKFSYAYHINLADDLKLGLGMRAGIFQQSFDPSVWNPTQPVALDNRLSYLSTNRSGSNFDLGAGLWLQGTKFFAGLSFSHLTQPTFLYNTVSDTVYDKSKIFRHYYITGGYIFTLNENWSLTPTALIKSDLLNFSHTQIDVSAIVRYNNGLFWGGLSYRLQESMVALIGVGLLNDRSLKIGYAFDLIVNGSNAKSGTSHEIMVTYSKPVAEILPRPIIRTPRFRY